MNQLSQKYQVAYKIHTALALFLLIVSICFLTGILFASKMTMPWRLIMGIIFIGLAFFIYREPEIIKQRMGKLVASAIDNKETIKDNIMSVLSNEDEKK